MVSLRSLECLRNVRYFRDHVDGDHPLCLRTEEYLASLVMACFQSGIPDGFSEWMAKKIERDNRCGMDSNQVWE